jgi:hypothetical protein
LTVMLFILLILSIWQLLKICRIVA